MGDAAHKGIERRKLQPVFVDHLNELVVAADQAADEFRRPPPRDRVWVAVRLSGACAEWDEIRAKLEQGPCLGAEAESELC